MVSSTWSTTRIATIFHRCRYVVGRMHIRGNVQSNSSLPRYVISHEYTNCKVIRKLMRSFAFSEYWVPLMRLTGLASPPSPTTKWVSPNGGESGYKTLHQNWMPTVKNFSKYAIHSNPFWRLENVDIRSGSEVKCKSSINQCIFRRFKTTKCRRQTCWEQQPFQLDGNSKYGLRRGRRIGCTTALGIVDFYLSDSHKLWRKSGDRALERERGCAIEGPRHVKERAIRCW